jgi:hypothetical protein
MRDICARKSRGNLTSAAAFAFTPEEIRREQARRIYKLLRRETLTCEEVAHRLQMRYTTASARISELLADGFVEDSGRRRVTSSGAYARVLSPCKARGRVRKTLRGFRDDKPHSNRRWSAVRGRAKARRYVCHGCGRIYSPASEGNTRCLRCQRMSRVMHHQKLKGRGLRRFIHHSCAECLWALRRGFTMEKP